jgi:hypothetical protein
MSSIQLLHVHVFPLKRAYRPCPLTPSFLDARLNPQGPLPLRLGHARPAPPPAQQVPQAPEAPLLAPDALPALQCRSQLTLAARVGRRLPGDAHDGYEHAWAQGEHGVHLVRGGGSGPGV